MSNINLVLLAAIVAATADPGYGMFARDADLTALVEGNYVAVNEGLTDEAEGVARIAAMATDLGKQTHANAGTEGTTEAAKPKVEKVKLATATMKRPAPVKRTREGGESKYPFDGLKLPNGDDVDAFFVPATAEMPDPAKSLTSAVSQANRKYGTVTGKNARGHDTYQYTRVFRILASDDPKGAYVWRDNDAKAGDTSASDADNDADAGTDQTTA